MDRYVTGSMIKRLREEKNITQSELADLIGVSDKAVSKWENGDALPDTGLLPELCDELNTTADKLLNGGSVLLKNRRLMRVEDVIIGFENIEDNGRYFGENCDFFTGMVEGINQKMNIDLLEYLRHRDTREVLWAEVLIQGILSGRTVDMDEVEANFTNKKMIAEIKKYIDKTVDCL